MADTGISGDFQKLATLLRTVESSADMRLRIAADMAEWARKRINHEFIAHVDPYGHRWAQRKKPDRRTNMLMFRTGRLMSGFVTSATPDAVTVQNWTPYAIFHQHGTFRMPARKMLPDEDDLGLWEKPLIKLALSGLKKAFAGVA